MSQEEILRVLNKEKKPLSARQISELLGKDVIVVSHSLARLIKYNEIGMIDLSWDKASKLFCDKRITRRVRIFYDLNINGEKMVKEMLKGIK